MSRTLVESVESHCEACTCMLVTAAFQLNISYECHLKGNKLVPFLTDSVIAD